MKFKKIFIMCLYFSILLCGCNSAGKENEAENETNTAVATENSDNSHATACTVDLTQGKYSEEKLDSTWNAASATLITLGDSSSSANSDTVSIDGDTISITQPGTYVISGTLSNGQLVVDIPNKGDVKLVLDNASITNSASSAIYVKEGKAVIVLADGTTNTFTDGDSYIFEDGEDEPDATIFSKDDLSFNGTGTLIVAANYKDGIKCKDDLKFISGNYEITSADDAVVGKDSISIKDGSFVIDSEGDSIKATNSSESDKGYVMIDSGAFKLTSSKDALVAETLLRINNGTFTISSGDFSGNTTDTDNNMVRSDHGAALMNSRGQTPPGGQMPGGNRGPGGMQPGGIQPGDGKDPFSQNSSNSSENTPSTKGLKSYVELVIAGGTFDISSEDDAIHSNQNITIDGGNLSMATNDDGIHAEKTLTINDGTIDITNSYEGLEAFDIIINDGEIDLTASDDGINAAGDADSATNPEDDETSNTEENVQDNFSDFRGGGDMNGMMAGEDQGATLTINGGYVSLIAEGDVIDANGDIIMTGGTVIAQGPTMGGNGTLDYASSFDIQGGTFWGIGSAQMAMNPASETQGLICGTVSEYISSGDTITIADESGNIIEELEVKVQGQWIGVCSPKIEKGSSYVLTIGNAQYSATAS